MLIFDWIPIVIHILSAFHGKFTNSSSKIRLPVAVYHIFFGKHTFQLFVAIRFRHVNRHVWQEFPWVFGSFGVPRPHATHEMVGTFLWLQSFLRCIVCRNTWSSKLRHRFLSKITLQTHKNLNMKSNKSTTPPLFPLPPSGWPYLPIPGNPDTWPMSTSSPSSKNGSHGA